MTKPFAKNKFFAGKPLRIYFDKRHKMYVDVKLDNITEMKKTKTEYFDTMIKYFYDEIRKENPDTEFYRIQDLRYTDGEI